MAVVYLLLLMVATTPSQIIGIKILNQISSCVVVTDQGTVDFSTLAGSPSSPWFSNVQSLASTSAYYDWNPCTDFTISQACATVAICRVDNNCIGKRRRFAPEGVSNHVGATCYQAIGQQSTSTFAVNPSNQLELQVYSASLGVTAHIEMSCGSSGSSDSFTCLDDVTDPNNPVFQLSGPHACFQQSTPTLAPEEGGLSVGSVLCIILLVVLVVYIVGGILYMKYRSGAEGANLIPNRKFWSAIPVHVKVGVLYVKSGFRPQALSYENI